MVAFTRGFTRTAMSVCALALGAMAPASAQDRASPPAVAEFYKGKTIQILLGGIGGEFDLNVRLMQRHFSDHMPGRPKIVPQYMTGAGGIKRANFLYEVAPKDGTVLGLIPENFPALQAIGGKGIQFDVRRFNWIGSFSPTVATFLVWHTAGVKTFEDMKTKEVIAGATGRDSITYIYPTLIKEFFGGKIKIITGYEGGSTINAAMERGEVHGRMNSWSSLKLTKPHWISEQQVYVVAQSGPKARDLPGVPTLEEIAANDDDRRIIELAVSGTYLGRPLATAPDVPAARVAALRQAFLATLKAPEFVADAEKAKIDLDPVSGDDLQAFVAKLLTFPERLVPRAKQVLE